MIASFADPAIADPPARVPLRTVIISACGLWLCYFVLATLRAWVVDVGPFWEMLWRRVLVSAAGIAITLIAWTVLRRFDARALPARVIAALLVMLPAALALALVNQQVFAPLERRMEAAEKARAKAPHAPAPGTTARVTIDGETSVLIDSAAIQAAIAEAQKSAEEARRDAAEAARDARDAAREAAGEARAAAAEARRAAGEAGVPVAPPAPPVPPTPPVSPTPPTPPTPPATRLPHAEPTAQVVVVHSSDAAPGAASAADHTDSLWQNITDIALGRYFLLLAWAALYLALGNAEEVRAAERREGEYRRAAKAAELRSLRYQVNPHFLFNTLNSLSALVMAGRGDEAERMIQSIASFYRHSLAGDPTGDVPLGEEIALQRHYLEIEAVRFPDRLRVDYQVPGALEDACVPGMILQPLVENSIKYAVSATRAPVTIRIAARDAGDLLVLTVADDGPGQNGEPGGTGIGLANVRRRLAVRFGAAAGVESGPLPAGGYATILTMPMVRHAG